MFVWYLFLCAFPRSRSMALFLPLNLDPFDTKVSQAFSPRSSRSNVHHHVSLNRSAVLRPSPQSHKLVSYIRRFQRVSKISRSLLFLCFADFEGPLFAFPYIYFFFPLPPHSPMLLLSRVLLAYSLNELRRPLRLGSRTPSNPRY